MITDGSVHAYARAAFYAGLAAWAWEELVGGVNWVRRTLGAGGLIYVVVKVAAALRA
jgi:hypothetical protein